MPKVLVRSLTHLFSYSLAMLLSLLLLTACGSSSGGSDVPETPDPPTDSDDDNDNDDDQEDPGNDDDPSSQAVRLNQLGFLPGGQKLAVVPDIDATDFIVVVAGTDEEVYAGELTGAASWAPSDESVKIADFSQLSTAGDYQIRVEGTEDSLTFTIEDDVYDALNQGALKAYYFNRASIELTSEFAGDYARPLGHPDTETEVFVHSSAATASRPEGSAISAPKGWYDAGDFGKYVVNSGISTYTLLAAYEHFPEYYTAQNLNIPESTNDVPDILDEARWNIEWMLAMQDEDGGVYHKLTTLNFAGEVMPHEATATRYVIGKGTAATLNFAAVMATASRVYAPFDESLAEQMLTAAESAWAWAQENDDVTFTNPEDVNTGEYGGSELPTNVAWAAAELYITTENADYYEAMNADTTQNWVPGWTNTRGLAWMSLAHHLDSLSEAVADENLIEQRIIGLADDLAAQHEASAYRVAMQPGEFYWGSNANVLNRAMMLLQGYRLDPQEERYREAAQSLFDYILGRNPTGYSYVTGFGHKTPMDIHHRVSAADDIDAPVPGFVAGGPNPSDQSDCEDNGIDYPSDLPAKSYLDDWCSYSTNEVTINWNAPLVYVSGALQALSQSQD